MGLKHLILVFTVSEEGSAAEWCHSSVTNLSRLNRIGRAAVVSTLAAAAVAVSGVGAATAGEAMPEWYTDNKIETQNCKAPTLIDDNHAKLYCHSKPSSRVIAKVPFGTWYDREINERLEVEVSVPATGSVVSAFTYEEDDTLQLLPRDSDTVLPGSASKSFRFDRHLKPPNETWNGTTLSVHTLFSETDVILTVHPRHT